MRPEHEIVVELLMICLGIVVGWCARQIYDTIRRNRLMKWEAEQLLERYEKEKI